MNVATVEENYEQACRTHNGDAGSASFLFLCAVAYFGMMVVGAVYFHDCLDTHMAIYTVVQGLFAMISMGLCAFGLMNEKYYAASICPVVIILPFNLIWSGVGFYWIVSSPSTCKDTTLYKAAIGFSVPMWIVLFLLLLHYCCRQFCK